VVDRTAVGVGDEIIHKRKRWTEKLIEAARDNFSRNIISYIFIAPFAVVFSVFVIIAVLWVFYLSLTYYNVLQSPTWVGFENYIRLFTNDPIFLIAFKNTLIFALITGPIGYFASLVMAWLINEVKRRKFFTIAFYIPSIISGVSIAVVWLYVFGGSKYGLLNFILIRLGIIDNPILWLRDTRFTLPSIMVVTLWMSMGTGFLVFIAGLQSLPRELYEAGVIDGTNKWQEFWFITIPMLRPQLLFGAVMAVVNSFQVFDLSYVMAGFPSVLYSAHTVVGHLYDYGFLRFEMGYSSAIAIVLFMGTLGLSRFFVWLLRSRD
jgi:multiple sugar transport system permease protein